MRRFSVLLLAVICGGLAFEARAACTIPLTFEGEFDSGEEYYMNWGAVAGIKGYRISESLKPVDQGFEYKWLIDPLVEPQRRLALEHIVLRDTKFYYIVEAYDATFTTVCRGTGSVTIPADIPLRTAVRRGVIPVVGSALGAYNAKFKTYLRLSTTTPPRSGRLVFHPAGRPSANNDPSIPYELTESAPSIVFDDVVAAMGQTGIGSLDIVPDRDTESEYVVPEADVRVFNEAPNGLFGCVESVYLPGSVLASESGPVQVADYADSRLRLNVGARTLGTAVAKVFVYDSLGKLRTGYPKSYRFEEPTMFLGNPDAIFPDTRVNVGDRLRIEWTGLLIPFHTFTENRTNDPFLFVAGEAVEGSAVISDLVK